MAVEGIKESEERVLQKVGVLTQRPVLIYQL